MRQPPRIAVVIGILQSIVLLDRRGVRKMKSVALLHQSIDQPVPVVGRFHYDPLKGSAIARELLRDHGKIVRQTLLTHHLIVLVDHHSHVVGGMQINGSVQFHPGSSFEWVLGLASPHLTASRRSLLDDYRANRPGAFYGKLTEKNICGS